MAAFGAVAIGSTGLGAVVMAWVEANPRLEWRWIQWIQYSTSTSYPAPTTLMLDDLRLLSADLSVPYYLLGFEV
jgi:hypothetical protein